MNTNSKRKTGASNVRIKEIQMKGHQSINHLFSPKKQYNHKLIKKNTVSSINSAHKENKPMNSKLTSITPKNNENKEYQSASASLNVSKFTPMISNSVKNSNKQFIHYASNIEVQKTQLNNDSLFTIHENKMNLSNGFYNKVDNNNSKSKKTQKQKQTDSTSSSNPKMIQIGRYAYPLNINQIVPKSNKTSKSTKTKIGYTLTQWNTNQSSFKNINNTKSNGNHYRKRNEKYLKTSENAQETTSPKRYYSLSKDLDSKNKSNNTSNCKKTKTNYGIYNVLNKVKEKSAESSDKNKHSQNKANKQHKHLLCGFKLSKSIKKEPSYFNNVNTNIKTYNNIRENSKDIQITQTNQNSYQYIKNNFTFLDTSPNQSSKMDKKKIKVNCKKSSPLYKSSMIIKRYSKYLSQNEIEELNIFALPIYYILPFEVRMKNNVQYSNELTSTFSYGHFPNYIRGGISLPRSKSYKVFYDVYSEAENYNDEEGNYILIAGEHIYYRYEIIELLGKGSFGEAVKCLDHKTKEIVCVKIIKSNPKFSIQAMIETKILKHIKKHDIDNNSNIVKFLSQFIFRNHIVFIFYINKVLVSCFRVARN